MFAIYVLLLAGRPVGGIVMRYIKSAMHNTDRLHKVYAPRLQLLAREIAARHPVHLTTAINSSCDQAEPGAS